MTDQEKSRVVRSEKHPDAPWKDEDLICRLYIDELRSMKEIGELLDCSPTTIREWIMKHDSIEKRTRSQAIQLGHGTLNHVPLNQHIDGYEEWKVGKKAVHVHRLLAVCEWGMEAVKGMHVHHKSGVPWDNRPDNLELLTPSDHHRQHKKITGYDRRMVAHTYENTDLSSRDVGDVFDISNGTVLRIHEEYYGDADD